MGRGKLSRRVVNMSIHVTQGQEEVMDLLQAAPFQNMYPRPFVKEDQSAEIVMQQMDQQYAPLHLVTMVTKHGTPQQARNAKDSDLLTKERLCRALSMFEVVMQRLKDLLMKDEEVRSTVWGGEGQAGSCVNLGKDEGMEVGATAVQLLKVFLLF